MDDPVATRERFAADLCPRVMLVCEGDAVVGYSLSELIGDVGYVRNVVTDPAHRRRGVGSLLMAALRERFVRGGATTWCLNVLPTNVAAVALYERCGMTIVYRSRALRVPASTVLPPPDSTLSFGDADPQDDATTEATFRLLPGQLASQRPRPNRRVVQLARGRTVIGIASFVTMIPGAFPFRISEANSVPTFVSHLRALRADAPFIQLVIEDDDALANAVLALGAYVHHETNHMRGPLQSATSSPMISTSR